MNLVGLYFFSFLICGHLLEKGIKNSRHRDRCDFWYTRNRASQLRPRTIGVEVTSWGWEAYPWSAKPASIVRR